MERLGAVAMVRLTDRGCWSSAAAACGMWPSSRMIRCSNASAKCEVVPNGAHGESVAAGLHDDDAIAHLQAINTAVIARVLATLGVRTWTIDVDGVVVSTGLQVERAFRGFNPHHRKVPSYYPIMAHLAETTHVLRVKNRSGNVHDGKAGLPFLRDLWTQLGTLLPRGGTVRFRMDGAFFRQDVLQWLATRKAGYAIKVPFYRWLDLQQYIRAQPTWKPVAPDVTGFVVPHAATPWGRPVWVAIYRKHVHHRATKNYQLDLFDPNDGHYEYSAVTSNLDLTLANLWRFACGRGNHEKTIAQLKSGLAFHTVPTMTYAANSAWQQLVVLTHNLLTNFQLETGAARRAPLAETDGAAGAPDYSVAPLRIFQPRGPTRAAPGRPAAAPDGQSRNPAEL